MLVYEMGVTVDGFTSDRTGWFGWAPPDDERSRLSLAHVGALGAHLCGRRLYEDMRVWETDPSIRSDPDRDAFADAWCALHEIVFSRTLHAVQGNARLARASVAEEVAAAQAATGRDVCIGGPGLAAAAVEADPVDEYRIFGGPVLVGGGTPSLPRVAEVRELELVESRTFASRVVSECWRRVTR